MTLLEMFRIICACAGRKVRYVNVPFPIAKLGVEAVYLLSFHRCDYREKLDRLMEDRAYPRDAITRDLGYVPHSFEDRVAPLVAEWKE